MRLSSARGAVCGAGKAESAMGRAAGAKAAAGWSAWVQQHPRVLSAGLGAGHRSPGRI